MAVASLSGVSVAHAETEVNMADVKLARVKAFMPSLSSSYQVERQFVGQVVAKQRADIGFELAGKISKIFVDEGDHVSQGEILMQLDTELLGVVYYT